MSYDKVSRSLNRHLARITVKQQVAIIKVNSVLCGFDPKTLGKFRKGKAMNCSCNRCRAWDRVGKRDRYKFELERSGMDKFDERPDIIKREEDWI